MRNNKSQKLNNYINYDVVILITGIRNGFFLGGWVTDFLFCFVFVLKQYEIHFIQMINLIRDLHASFCMKHINNKGWAKYMFNHVSY